MEEEVKEWVYWMEDVSDFSDIEFDQQEEEAKEESELNR